MAYKLLLNYVGKDLTRLIIDYTLEKESRYYYEFYRHTIDHLEYNENYVRYNYDFKDNFDQVYVKMFLKCIFYEVKVMNLREKLAQRKKEIEEETWKEVHRYRSKIYGEILKPYRMTEEMNDWSSDGE